jgi:uncharacterized protein with beta-barrel porin domain
MFERSEPASVALSKAVVTLRGRAAWAHNSNTDRSISALLQAIPAAGFTVFGASPAQNSALVSAGAEAKWLNGFSVAATFEGEFSSRTDSYAGKSRRSLSVVSPAQVLCEMWSHCHFSRVSHNLQRACVDPATGRR